MANVIRLTKKELQNLKEGLDKAMAELQSKKDSLDKFSDRPIEFLNKFGIDILEYIRKSRNLRERFITGVREIIGSFRHIVNKCLRCKIAVLLILLGTLGKSGMVWGGLMEALDKVMDSVKNFFEHTSSQMDRALRSIEAQLNGIRPANIALRICESLGYCPA